MAAKYQAPKLLILVSLIFISQTIISCQSGADTTISVPTIVSFERDIQPIFDAKCVSCHNLTTFAGGLNLSPGAAYKSLVNAKSDQSTRNYVTPGSPDNSYLINKLVGNQSNVGGLGASMPLGGPALPDSQITMIRQWIFQGALNN